MKGLSARSLFGNYQLDHQLGLWEIGKGRQTRLINILMEKKADPIYAYFIDIEDIGKLVEEVKDETNVDLDSNDTTDGVKLQALKKWIVGDSTAGAEKKDKLKNSKCKFAVAGGVEFGTAELGISFSRGMVVFLIHKSQSKLNLDGTNDIITVLVS